MSNLTFWHSPFDPTPLDALAERVKAKCDALGASPNIIIPTHYGRHFQDTVHQSLDTSLLVSSISKLAAIRRTVEAKGIGFGAWGVPLDVDDAHLAATVANTAGFYVANIEPDTLNYWHPGNNGNAAQSWIDTFKGSIHIDSQSVGVTLIPNVGHLSWSDASLHAWFDDFKMCTEIYGGPGTSQYYKYPNIWPWPSYAAIDKRFTWWQSEWLLYTVPILHVDNLDADYKLFETLSGGNVQVWGW